MRGFLRGLAIFILGGLLGTGFGFALGIFFFPYIFPPPEANEVMTPADLQPQVTQPQQPPQPQPAPQAQQEPQTQQPQTQQAPQPQQVQPVLPKRIASGTFIHADPSDRVHWGKGRVSVFQNLVFLEPGFEVGPGPDFRVLLVPKAGIKTNADVRAVLAKSVDLGGLRAFKGSQKYSIPANVDLSQYQSVVIWCRAFSQLISPADLKR
jgi:hypothetical protein